MSRRFAVHFILFLCLGVMNRELPECMALRDDVSNDGDVAVYALQLPQGVSSCADTPGSQATCAFSKGLFPSLLPGRRCFGVPALVARAGVGLLRLIDQQRC